MNSDEEIITVPISDMQLINNWRELIINIQKLKDQDFGCPWQKKQTHQSLIPFLIEESYELVNAINDKNSQNISEELGDLLLQILLHSEIAQENREFDLNDIINSLNKKIQSRHPYIFINKRKISYEEAQRIWEEEKRKEKSISNKICISSELLSKTEKMPATISAEMISKKVNNLGFKWINIKQIFDKLSEEIEELKEAIENKEASYINEEFGDIYFTLINLSLFLKINHETCLISANKKFLKRFAWIEKLAGDKIDQQTFEDFQRLWKKAKRKS